MGEDLVCPGWELTMWLLVVTERRVCVVGKQEQGKHPLWLLGSSALAGAALLVPVLWVLAGVLLSHLPSVIS